MQVSVKRRIFLLLDPNEGGSKWDRLVNTVIVTLIILNTLAVIVETLDNVFNAYAPMFRVFEVCSIAFFSTEYVLRVWTITENIRFKGEVSGRIKYILTPAALVDLFAILPFYLPLVLVMDLRFLRIVRMIRFFRFFKLGRYTNASKLILRVFRSKKEELILSFLMTLSLIIFSASIMYFIEHDAQPDKFSSIPETMWWSVATLTTVGYGDVYPITITGKILASFISILGIGMFALPAGILASGFSDEFKQAKRKQRCPNCHAELNTE